MSDHDFETLLDAVEWTAVEPPDLVEPQLLHVTHEGVLRIGGTTFRVHRLSDGQRVLNGEDVDAWLSAALEDR